MHPSQSPARGQQRRIREYAGSADSYAMFNLLTGPQLLDQVEALLPEHRERLFPPTETLSMFLAQLLSADGSCRQVVNDVMVKRVIGGLKPGSTDTGGYCKACARLPMNMVSTLAREAGGIVAKGAPCWWQWRSRVRLVDSATVKLPDTEEYQAAYPHSSSQKPGLGLPICRVVALLCLGSGAALLDAAMGPCEGKGSDEQSLLRDILDSLQNGDILLGDALYATYSLLRELILGGADGLFEQHGRRKHSTDFSQGKKLGVRDHLIRIRCSHCQCVISVIQYRKRPA